MAMVNLLQAFTRPFRPAMRLNKSIRPAMCLNNSLSLCCAAALDSRESRHMARKLQTFHALAFGENLGFRHVDCTAVGLAGRSNAYFLNLSVFTNCVHVGALGHLGFGFRVQGFGFGVQGLGFRV